MPSPRPAFATRVWVAALIVWASLRVWFWWRRLDLLDLPARLRAARPLPRRFADPALLGRGLRRLGPWLPPRALGPCLRESLVLIDLLARCGLEGRLHCGLRRVVDRSTWEGHAWVSSGGAFFPSQSAVPPGFAEIWAA
jgi:hypothetical protein